MLTTERYPLCWDNRKADDNLKRNQQQIPLGWETSQQNAMFYNDEIWLDAALSPSGSDTSSPQVRSEFWSRLLGPAMRNAHAKIEQTEQQNITVWEASSQKAREYMLDRQLEQDPILFPYDNSPLDFISTSLSREHVSESSLTVSDIWYLTVVLIPSCWLFFRDDEGKTEMPNVLFELGSEHVFRVSKID
jgi:hypothetical protein